MTTNSISTPVISLRDTLNQYFEANLSIFPVVITSNLSPSSDPSPTRPITHSGSSVVPPSGWNKYCNNIPSTTDRNTFLDRWEGTNPPAVGLATGKVYDASSRLVCIDIDHPALVRTLSYLFPSPSARFGSKGIGLFYRVDKDSKDLRKSRNFMIAGRPAPAVEYLSADRFTFIPPSVHRKTGKQYEWKGMPLLSVLGQLPELTAKDLDTIKVITSFDSDGGTVETIMSGEGTHSATLALIARLVSLRLDPERIIRAVELLFPTDYRGDTKKQLPEMVESAVRKGFDKAASRPSDGDLTDEDYDQIFRNWHYVTQINRMVNTETLDTLDQERFNMVFAGQVKRAWTVYGAWPNASIKKSITYLPAKPPVLEDEINMWRPSELNPKSGSVELWLDHINRFYPKDEVEHVLNWMAYVLQNPAVKPSHVILLGSKYEGIGKDLWLIPVRACFGKRNVSEIGADALSSQFNEWLAHKQLIIIQEVWTGSRRELSNQLKPLLASPPEEIHINEKGISRYPIPNICSVIMLTNHKDAVSMAAEDRRYFVMWSDAEPESHDYYEKFATWVEDPENQSRVFDYLLKRDISKFSIKARPPKTKAKADMVDATMTRSENLVVVVRDILRDIAMKDAVSEVAAYDALLQVAPDIARSVMQVPRTSPRYPIRLALKELGYEKMDKMAVRKVGGQQHRIAVHVLPESRERYEKMSASDLYSHVMAAVDY